MPPFSELLANVLVTASIVFAARNSIHVWWSTIAGCAVFAWVFWHARLYADVVLQFFFIAIAVAGWWNWRRGDHGRPAPVRWTRWRVLAPGIAASLAFAAAWAYITSRFTDAAAPVPDALVLGLSVLAQLLMMARRVENWHLWIVVNTIAVPLFWSRDLKLTAVLYAFYWLNAWWALFHWKKLAVEPRPA